MLGRESSGCQDILQEVPPCWGAGALGTLPPVRGGTGDPMPCLRNHHLRRAKSGARWQVSAPRSLGKGGGGGLRGGGEGARLSPGQAVLSAGLCSAAGHLSLCPLGTRCYSTAELRALRTAGATVLPGAASWPPLPRGLVRGPPSSTAREGARSPAPRSPPLSASAWLLPTARAPYLGAALPVGLRGTCPRRGRCSQALPPASRAAAADTRGAPRAANLEMTSTVGPTSPGTSRVGWRKGGADPAAAAQ